AHCRRGRVALRVPRARSTDALHPRRAFVTPQRVDDLLPASSSHVLHHCADGAPAALLPVYRPYCRRIVGGATSRDLTQRLRCPLTVNRGCGYLCPPWGGRGALLRTRRTNVR